MRKAALYLRSSKDRSDVSIASQRTELTNLATEKNITIVEEYKDVVESGKTDQRPGFQNMLRDLKSKNRNWDTLLMVDTSRLSRRRYVAQVFKHEAKKKNVQILYSKVPNVDPISQVILEAVFEAMDEVHSIMSKEKGLAGMAQNIRQGYRAGGSAPKGYQLKHVQTGAVRDGNAVEKSVLIKSNEAHLIGAYLKMRARGIPRAKTKRELNITIASSTLVGIEWNALTYAGHTIWNVRNETIDGKYRGGTKRKPRKQWCIKENTHEPIITNQEAEIILNTLENSTLSSAVSNAKRGLSPYLLTGVLVSPDGRKWEGQKGNKSKAYRLKSKNKLPGKWLNMEEVDTAVTQKILSDMESPTFINQLLKEIKKTTTSEDPCKDLRIELIDKNRQISKTMDLAIKLDDPAPAIRKADELERQRKTLAAEITRIEKEYSAQMALQNISENEVKKLLNSYAIDLKTRDKYELKKLIQWLVRKVELDPNTYDAVIYYKIIADDSLDMASPGAVADWAAIYTQSVCTV